MNTCSSCLVELEPWHHVVGKLLTPQLRPHPVDARANGDGADLVRTRGGGRNPRHLRNESDAPVRKRLRPRTTLFDDAQNASKTFPRIWRQLQQDIVTPTERPHRLRNVLLRNSVQVLRIDGQEVQLSMALEQVTVHLVKIGLLDLRRIIRLFPKQGAPPSLQEARAPRAAYGELIRVRVACRPWRRSLSLQPPKGFAWCAQPCLPPVDPVLPNLVEHLLELLRRPSLDATPLAAVKLLLGPLLLDDVAPDAGEKAAGDMPAALHNQSCLHDASHPSPRLPLPQGLALAAAMPGLPRLRRNAQIKFSTLDAPSAGEASSCS
mmetsp:Transcript_54958/g.178610  ORF Transcript_54958/g.178610 Transcript_54958/m.178610 type:complete len:321 (-) Transcript_54958:1268-2230(-)